MSGRHVEGIVECFVQGLVLCYGVLILRGDTTIKIR
jgi:hypothetical protein